MLPPPFLLPPSLRLIFNTPRHVHSLTLPSTARNSRPLEVIGTYDPIPKKDPYDNSGKLHKDIKLDTTRAKYWIGVGAQPTDTMWRLLSMVGRHTSARILSTEGGSQANQLLSRLASSHQNTDRGHQARGRHRKGPRCRAASERTKCILFPQHIFCIRHSKTMHKGRFMRENLGCTIATNQLPGPVPINLSVAGGRASSSGNDG